MTKEALKLALEALEFVNQTGDTQTFDMCYADKAITAIKEALAQEQEPVAWWNDTGTHIDLNVSGRGTPLYTHPVKDLEDININITWNENSMRDFGKDELNFARAILRKAQEK